jgi:hypothetical protein
MCRCKKSKLELGRPNPKGKDSASFAKEEQLESKGCPDSSCTFCGQRKSAGTCCWPRRGGGSPLDIQRQLRFVALGAALGFKPHAMRFVTLTAGILRRCTKDTTPRFEGGWSSADRPSELVTRGHGGIRVKTAEPRAAGNGNVRSEQRVATAAASHRRVGAGCAGGRAFEVNMALCERL